MGYLLPRENHKIRIFVKIVSSDYAFKEAKQNILVMVSLQKASL